jgi:hypothetical protein
VIHYDITVSNRVASVIEARVYPGRQLDTIESHNLSQPTNTTVCARLHMILQLNQSTQVGFSAKKPSDLLLKVTWRISTAEGL